MKRKNETYDIFISYRRDGGEFTAKILRDRLEAMGYRVFYDVETLRSGDFNTRLYDVIDHCRDFLLVLSPHALDRCANEGDWVRYEVERALLKQKNIVPVLLRDFEFPAQLPPSMEPLRYKNGLQANTQFFDAFIDTLREYLTARPKRRLRLFLLIGAAVLAAAALLFGALWAGSHIFPLTGTEKSVTGEVLQYVETNLTHMDLMLSSADHALDSARRYLTTGSGAYSSLDAAFDTAITSISSLDLDICAPADGMLQRVGQLRGTPFAAADLIGMYDVAVTTQTEWAGELSFVLWATGPDSYLSPDDRLAVVDILQSLLEEDGKLNAYCANELLLPVTGKGMLEDFFRSYLPGLRYIPLSAASWIDDRDVLRAAEEGSYDQQSYLLADHSATVGSMTMADSALRESLIFTYENAAGLSRSEAEQLVEQWLRYMELCRRRDELTEQKAEQLEQLRPQPDDGWDTLWLKLQGLMSVGEYDRALECVDALDVLMDGDEYAAVYLPALRLFVSSAGTTGVNYGVMVMQWYDPDEPNEVLRIGDVIVAVDGEPCRTTAQYGALKATRTGPYTVTVMRADGDGVLAATDLTLAPDMPLVYTMDISVVDEQ